MTTDNTTTTTTNNTKSNNHNEEERLHLFIWLLAIMLFYLHALLCCV